MYPKTTQFFFLLFFSYLALPMSGDAQSLFPVKEGKRWGFIDAEGKMRVLPRYDAIGDFNAFGYATMQLDGEVGLLNRKGQEIIRPCYEDVRVLDTQLVAIMDEGIWEVRNLQGQIILSAGYEQLDVWPGGFLGFSRQGKWGVVDYSGHQILPSQFDQITFRTSDSCFYLHQEGKIGLADRQGNVFLSPRAEVIRHLTGRGYAFQINKRWGVTDLTGRVIVEPEFLTYEEESDHYLKLYKIKGVQVYSWVCNQLIHQDHYEDFFALNSRYLITVQQKKVGLLNWCGEPILSGSYDEILWFGPSAFRVRQEGAWSIIVEQDSILTEKEYDYIGPLTGQGALVRSGDHYGLVNGRGELLIPTKYDSMEWDGRKATAFRQKGEGAEIYYLDEKGNSVSTQQLSHHFTVRVKSTDSKAHSEGLPSNPVMQKIAGRFEWYYQSGSDRWGLRNRNTGEVQLSPAFRQVKPIPNTALTLVSLAGKTPMELERTSFRFDQVFGLVNHELGALVTDLQFLDVRFSDFEETGGIARCMFTDASFGLVDRAGQIIARGFSFIGPFREGRARASSSGQLTGSLETRDGLIGLQSFLDQLLSPYVMTDYTRYDQIFLRKAELVCADCAWGYIDEAGHWAAKPVYAFARDMVNEVGIVRQGNKWGAIHRTGDELIPCAYDEIHFLEQTDNQILRLYVEKPKYGLIDTFGRLAIRATYDDIGLLKEGRLAVKHQGLWGFTNLESQEIISCRFESVLPFSEGLAAVLLKGSWGFIDRLGELIIPFRYKSVGSFSNGLAWVETSDGFVFINERGEVVIEGPFEEACDFALGVARIRQNGQWGLLDTTGKVICTPRFKEIKSFDAELGVAIVRYGKTGEKYGLINQQGRVITANAYRDIQAFSEGLAVVKERDRYGYINQRGQLVVPAIYSRAEAFSGGRAAVYLNGSCGYIDCLGDKRSDFSFSRCNPFEDGKAIVYRGLRRAGLIDQGGNLLIEPSVDRLLSFSEGRGLVRESKYRFYFISEQADIHQGVFEKASDFEHGVAVVRLNNKWGMINRSGLTLIPPKYSQIDQFRDGYARVRVEGFSGLANTQGEHIMAADFEVITYVGEGVFRVEQGGKVGYFKEDGDWIWDLNE